VNMTAAPSPVTAKDSPKHAVAGDAWVAQNREGKGSNFASAALYLAIMPHLDIAHIPTRAPSETSTDDTILPFRIEALDLRGQLVRFGPAIDTILARHRYPQPVAKLVGEAIVLTVLLGSTLKFEGRFILQTQSDGPVRMLVIDYATPGRVRACARFDAGRVAAAIAAGTADAGTLLGHGHLAMTIDQGPDTARYQGIVALDGKDLEHAAHEYFLRSEQIPTRVRLAVAEELRAGQDGARHHWRAGGLLLQFLPQPDRSRPSEFGSGEDPADTDGFPATDDDAWIEGRSLVGTVTDVELLDPEVSSEQLLYRLFRERGVRVFRSRSLHAQCSCSRDGVEQMLRSFPPEDREHMVENGKITVTCEFCNSTYLFQPEDVIGSTGAAKPSVGHA
jgi:molecular chaperone Hsp33